MTRFQPESGSTVSVTDRVRPLALGQPVTSVHFLGDRAAFVGAEESVVLVDAQGDDRKGLGSWQRHPLRGVRRQAHRDGGR